MIFRDGYEYIAFLLKTRNISEQMNLKTLENVLSVGMSLMIFNLEATKNPV